MRDDKEVVPVAQQLKVKIINRAAKMEEMVSRQAKSDAGMIRALHHEVYDTITRDLGVLKQSQQVDTCIYAALRWVLGITEEINLDDLGLDE